MAGNNVIRLDMSEYKEAHSISKIIGAPPGYVGYEDVSNVLEDIRNKPFSVLILDEIEKAHRDIINLFLGVLDEGIMKDSRGNEVRFDNVVIIMTSNSGFNEINVGFNNENNLSSKLNDSFSIPFMNRVDRVIMFNYLKKEDIDNIINDKLKDLKHKYKDKITINISDSVLDEIREKANYELYGARKISKIIKDDIENKVIDALINNKEKINIKGLKEENVIL